MPETEVNATKIASKSSKPLIVALDYANEDLALNMASQLDVMKCRVKVGKELFTRSGPQVVRKLTDMGFDVFLDLKFHDIPNTVAKAVLAAAESGAWMVNVHACGGIEMMEAASEALQTIPKNQRPMLIAVTVLTSMNESQLMDLGVKRSLNDQVLHLASLAAQSGIDGVVCSAREAAAIKQACGAHFTTVTPGIRPDGSDLGDQQRVMTPSEAISNGSDYLVIGRPITTASRPMEIVRSIQIELDSVS